MKWLILAAALPAGYLIGADLPREISDGMLKLLLVAGAVMSVVTWVSYKNEKAARAAKPKRGR